MYKARVASEVAYQVLQTGSRLHEAEQVSERVLALQVKGGFVCEDVLAQLE